MRILLSAFVVVTLSSICVADKGLRFELEGQQHTVLPLGYSSEWVLALKRNGQLLQVRPQQMRNAKMVHRFRPFSQGEARGELLHEFGKGYEVSGTGNYLIVHPRGKRDLWADRFEQLYRSMTHFFRARGYPMTKPQFPMIGIVFQSQASYVAYSRHVLKSNVRNSYGVYLPSTNRIYLYDATRGAGTGSSEWAENLATIMHESAHQTAFNTGIHRRGAADPHWVVEGLGCLFEAPGIYDALHFGDLAHRINYGRLFRYRESVKEDAATLLSSVVASDNLFRRDPSRAYAVAWGLTFYFSERDPRNYMRFLRNIAKREAFTEYTESDRMADFTSVFGKDFRMLAARVERFLQSLPKPKQPVR